MRKPSFIEILTSILLGCTVVSAVGQTDNIEPILSECEFPSRWSEAPRFKFWYTLDEGGESGLDLNDIDTSLDMVNSLFQPVGIQFSTMGSFPMANYQFDLLESEVEELQMSTMYYHLGAINVYLVSGIANFSDSDPDGYVFLPPKTRDVIIMNKADISAGSMELAHLLGHYFGLHNTDEDEFGEELADGSNCDTAGDLICDTYADPGGNADVGDNCNYSGPEFMDAAGVNFYPPVDNVMSNYTDACRCRYTIDQFFAMNLYRYEIRTNLW